MTIVQPIKAAFYKLLIPTLSENMFDRSLRIGECFPESSNTILVVLFMNNVIKDK